MLTKSQSRFKRLWQPHNPLFWLMILFNGLSSVLAWVLHLMSPQGGILWVLTLFALGNALAGMGLLWHLWTASEWNKSLSQDSSNT